ncbi:MAG: hypothetical protein M1830_005181, partial [Pleopsidium flavum]
MNPPFTKVGIELRPRGLPRKGGSGGGVTKAGGTRGKLKTAAGPTQDDDMHAANVGIKAENGDNDKGDEGDQGVDSSQETVQNQDHSSGNDATDGYEANSFTAIKHATAFKAELLRPGDKRGCSPTSLSFTFSPPVVQQGLMVQGLRRRPHRRSPEFES